VKRLFNKLGFLNSKEEEKEARKITKVYPKDTKDVKVSEKLNGIAFGSMAKDNTLKGSFFSKEK